VSYILAKATFAIRDAITAQAFTWPASIRADVSRGQMDDDDTLPPASNPLPSIIVAATSAEQIHTMHATFDVRCMIEVRHQADDTPADTHLANCVELAEWMYGDDFQTDVNTGTGFTMFGRTGINQTFERSGRRWVTRFEFGISAAPSTIN
jgi:hypothetical protein